VDFDADGILDMISGSYDPGDLYLFRGLGKGKYAKGETILDENRVPLVHHPEHLARYNAAKAKDDDDGRGSIQDRVASFGSWPAMVDWDADGDLDMLIGSFSGGLFLRMNGGTRSKPRFTAPSPAVEVDGKPLKVNAHACPAVADWDGDGRWDLVVGAGDGSVAWYRNTGAKDKPVFGPGETLVAARSDNKFLTQHLEPDEIPGQGARAQICVADYDRDGKLDLLVGDHSSVSRLRKGLDADAPAQLARILARLRELSGQGTELTTIGSKDANKAEIEKLTKAKSELLDGGAVTHSFVWLYRRQ
jgi:hypothetical protein